MHDFREVIEVVITRFIIPILPLYIFGIFLQLGAEGNVGPVLGTFAKIIVIIIVMHVTVLLLQFLIMIFRSDLLCSLDRFQTFLGQFLSVHFFLQFCTS